jgi:hypothetical protein
MLELLYRSDAGSCGRGWKGTKGACVRAKASQLTAAKASLGNIARGGAVDKNRKGRQSRIAELKNKRANQPVKATTTAPKAKKDKSSQFFESEDIKSLLIQGGKDRFSGRPEALRKMATDWFNKGATKPKSLDEVRSLVSNREKFIKSVEKEAPKFFDKAQKAAESGAKAKVAQSLANASSVAKQKQSQEQKAREQDRKENSAALRSKVKQGEKEAKRRKAVIDRQERLREKYMGPRKKPSSSGGMYGLF